MKTVKKVKYLDVEEACWYVGVDEKFIDIFAKQGKVNTIGKKGAKFYDLDGLNAIKDVLADDAGEQKIASQRQVTLNIGNDLQEPLTISVATLSCVVSATACLVCVLIVLLNYGIERQPHSVNNPMETVRSEIPESILRASPELTVSAKYSVRKRSPEAIDRAENSRSAMSTKTGTVRATQ